MKLKIDWMREEDLDQVLAIERSSYAVPWTRGIFQQELRNKQSAFYITARSEKKIVGYGGLWLIWKEGHITNITVDQRFRRRGIGSLLLIKLIELARGEGVKLVTLEVRVSNIAAVKLYESFAFKKVGKRKGYYMDNNEDALIMHCQAIQDDEMAWVIRQHKERLLRQYQWELEPCVAS